MELVAQVLLIVVEKRIQEQYYVMGTVVQAYQQTLRIMETHVLV
jgi:hypothetical protein